MIKHTYIYIYICITSLLVPIAVLTASIPIPLSSVPAAPLVPAAALGVAPLRRPSGRGCRDFLRQLLRGFIFTWRDDLIWGFPYNGGTPIAGWLRENLLCIYIYIYMDDLGVPPYMETPKKRTMILWKYVQYIFEITQKDMQNQNGDTLDK